MSAFEQGTVAIATVRGVPNVRIAYADSSDVETPWFALTGDEAACWVSIDQVSDIRPLVMLDLGPGRIPAAEAVRLLRTGDSNAGYEAFLDWLADQIEAQTKPPRIPEPGWGAIVEAGVKEHDERLLWTPNDQGFWACRNPDEYARNWGELIDPSPIRDGIDGGAS